MPVCVAWHFVMREKKEVVSQTWEDACDKLQLRCQHRNTACTELSPCAVDEAPHADLPIHTRTAGRKQERFHFNYLCQIWLSSILEDERQRCNTQFSLRKDNFWADNQLSFMVSNSSREVSVLRKTSKNED